MKLKVLAILVMGLVSIQGYAQEGFTYYGTSSRGTDYYYKIKSDKSSDDLGLSKWSKEVWIMSIDKPRTIKNKKGKYVKTGGGKILDLIDMYCSSQKYQIKSSIEYNSKGKVIWSKDFPSFPEYIVPGSVMETLYDEICD